MKQDTGSDAIWEKVYAWGGPISSVMLGVGLYIMGFVPPPHPSLSAAEVATLYQENYLNMRFGILLSLLGLPGWAAYVGVISTQMLRAKGVSRLGAFTHLGTGSAGVLTVVISLILMATCAYRPERDPQLTLMLNDLIWLSVMMPIPTFITQYASFAIAVLGDKSAEPIFPRWTAYYSLWAAFFYTAGAFAFFVRSGPFAWSNLFPFWLGGAAFFLWLLILTPYILRNAERGRENAANI